MLSTLYSSSPNVLTKILTAVDDDLFSKALSSSQNFTGSPKVCFGGNILCTKRIQWFTINFLPGSISFYHKRAPSISKFVGKILQVSVNHAFSLFWGELINPLGQGS